MADGAAIKALGAGADALLVQRAKAGDYGAFEQLVARYERPVYTLALRMLRRPEDAEEVVQETFLSVVEHLKGFREESSFFTWLVRIATNHALKALRRRKRVESVTAPTGQADPADEQSLPHPEFIAEWSETPDAIVLRRETQQLLAEALDTLDEKYRMVFLLRDVEGLSTEEAAGALGITVANAKVRLLRARLMLREYLTQRLGDASRQLPHAHG